MPTLFDIEMAFDFVSSASEGENTAAYDRVSDRFYYYSEAGELDEFPEDLDWEQCVEVPHKNDLDLGNRLVFRFARRAIPGEEEVVRRFFQRPGAYARYKDFLDRRGLLQAWYDFASSARRAAIEDWCRENEVPITSEESPGSLAKN